MPEERPFEFRPLQASDEPHVRGWLLDYLQRHISGWAHAHGLDWTDAEIDEHIDQHGLVEREWVELRDAASSTDTHVELAVGLDDLREPQAIVYAELRPDRYLKLTLGVMSWLYVARPTRGKAIGTALSRRAIAWMRSRGVTAAEVFVTRSNVAAIRCYERAEFRTLDLRMIASIAGHEIDET